MSSLRSSEQLSTTAICQEIGLEEVEVKFVKVGFKQSVNPTIAVDHEDLRWQAASDTIHVDAAVIGLNLGAQSLNLDAKVLGLTSSTITHHIDVATEQRINTVDLGSQSLHLDTNVGITVKSVHCIHHGDVGRRNEDTFATQSSIAVSACVAIGVNRRQIARYKPVR